MVHRAIITIEKLFVWFAVRGLDDKCFESWLNWKNWRYHSVYRKLGNQYAHASPDAEGPIISSHYKLSLYLTVIRKFLLLAK